MVHQLTGRARLVVVQTQEEARMLNHDYVGTEHLLLGLIHESVGGLMLPPSLSEHPAAELSAHDSARLGEDRRQPGHMA
jgi:ATP-dependent Clp protease ATP-binding subunit ClpA